MLLLLGFAPPVVAQQYCVSGAVTSILSCNSCGFNVGDPVAMTFTVQPSSITCTSSSPIVASCLADATFSANIGARYWTDAKLGNANLAFLFNGVGSTSYTDILLTGSVPTPPFGSADPLLLLRVNVDFSHYPGNLIPNGTLPSSLPSPSEIAAANLPNVDLEATVGGGASPGANPHFSYTGETCAANPSPGAPTINTGGVVPIYSSSSTIQPGSWVSIYGTNLAAAATTWNGDFPVLLGGTSVTINNKPAYLWYVSPGQINLQAPDDTATGNVSVVVTTGSGTAQSSVILSPFSPSFSLFDGKHVAGIILRSDGSGAYGGGVYDIVGPTGTSLGYKTVAAKAGDILEIFGVGFGPTSPAVAAGKVYSGAAATTNSVMLSINNVAVTPTFAGITSPGLYQINFILPAGLGAGDVPLQGSVGGAQTQTGVVLSVQ